VDNRSSVIDTWESEREKYWGDSEPIHQMKNRLPLRDEDRLIDVKKAVALSIPSVSAMTISTIEDSARYARDVPIVVPLG
jgi:hypothetical protein